MRIGGSGKGRRGYLVLAVAMGLAGLPAAAHAQFFNPPAVQRPPADVPSVPGPAQSLAPPAGTQRAAAAVAAAVQQPEPEPRRSRAAGRTSAAVGERALRPRPAGDQRRT